MNDKLCPLCGKPNNCQAHTSNDCWCNHVVFPEELLNRIPAEQRRKSCVCRECLEAFNREKV